MLSTADQTLAAPLVSISPLMCTDHPLQNAMAAGEAMSLKSCGVLAEMDCQRPPFQVNGDTHAVFKVQGGLGVRLAPQ